ncbi:hypothetical protein PoB_000242300 [Plakobranchus ocellatus]|uniref:Uncharacterized protein n=1 Tax=Plakobranchus ocellatus TaxID=259542 RepID=A0AAV3XZU7_9GAST|nr:hypothetical protein PoB_000242300 [Plakobranchus ocellatus]
MRWLEAEGRGEVQMDQGREDGLAGSRGEGRGPDRPGQGGCAGWKPRGGERFRWIRAGRMGWALRVGRGEGRWKRWPGGDGEGPVGWGSWGGAIKSAVRHKSPMCSVACPYEGRYVQGASACTATVLTSDIETRHFRTG